MSSVNDKINNIYIDCRTHTSDTLFKPTSLKRLVKFRDSYEINKKIKIITKALDTPMLQSHNPTKGLNS